MKTGMHFVRISAVIILITACTFYPFLPGNYDASAVNLSTMVQLFAAVGLVLVLIGVLWLVYEMRKRARRKMNHPATGRGHYFAMAALLIASILAIFVSLMIFFGIGISFGVLAFALWFYAVSRLIPGLKLLKQAEVEDINPAPIYLIFIPITILFFQITLATPATEFSRNNAIANSAELINDIEEYYAANGYYPSSLLAVWKDYQPSVVGIEQYHYAPNGDAYNLFFEQPRLLFDNFGTREFVMYNKLDEHVMPSHASWILIFSPEELMAQQGWYAVNDTSIPHWKYFWFD